MRLGSGFLAKCCVIFLFFLVVGCATVRPSISPDGNLRSQTSLEENATENSQFLPEAKPDGSSLKNAVPSLEPELSETLAAFPPACDPVEEQVAPAPVEEQVALGVLEEQTASDPLEERMASDPLEEQRASDPLEGQRASDPLEGQRASDPPEGQRAPGPGRRSDQELLDSALEFCQASYDFRNKGDLDNALDALDQAYSLILKIDPDSKPEILQQRDDLRITVSKSILECYASRFTVANGDHKAIPLVMNEHVKAALNRLTGAEKSFFLAAYRRSGRYRPAIVKALKEAGLPEELSWLPLIESGFKARALSHARALGIWQFIPSTGYKYGLKRNQWVDERMDFERSTQAAVGYLKELHQIFGDWTTVLAAYNCGENRVLRYIRTQKINYLDDFWDLYEKLPRETAFYVPRFLAVLHIINDPDAYNIGLPPADPPFEFEVVTINKQIHLKTIADRLDLPLDLLQELNASLRHDATPDRPYGFKVPVGKGEILLAEVDKMPLYAPPVPAYAVHRVRRGETLSGIALRHRSSVKGIMLLNGLKSSNYVKVGWTLKVPTRSGPLLAQVARNRQSLTGKEVKHRVRRGDSLWEIARRFGTSVESIQSLNGIQGTHIQVGQVLTVRGGSRDITTSKTKKYSVNKGDSPYLIAQEHRMNLSDFLALNKLTPRSTIFPGEVLLVKAE